MKRIVRSRKLLVASVGVASVLYACEKPYPPGNLVAPPPDPDAGMVTSGNLMAPPEPQPSATTTASAIEPIDASKPPTADAGLVPLPMQPPGNLMPPPPPPKPTPPKPKK